MYFQGSVQGDHGGYIGPESSVSVKPPWSSCINQFHLKDTNVGVCVCVCVSAHYSFPCGKMRISHIWTDRRHAAVWLRDNVMRRVTVVTSSVLRPRRLAYIGYCSTRQNLYNDLTN